MDPVGIFFFALIAILAVSAIIVPKIQRASQKSGNDSDN